MKICFITLGCKVNQYESIELANQLCKEGHDVTEKREIADLYIINTCAVTQFAEKKSRYEVTRVIRENPEARIIVCGCASEFDAEQFKSKNVIAVCGTDKSRILSFVQSIACKEKTRDACGKQKKHAKNRVFIKVQDGCNNFCSYCIVPHLRGRSRSRNINEIISEIAELPANIKEITLTGIDLSSYNFDDNGTSLPLADLCKAVDSLNRPFRLSSLEVGIITPLFLHALSKCRNFLPHFHLSLQSGSDDVLKTMNRKYTTAEYFKRVELIRAKFPWAAITTDIIVGFPSETDSNFNETLNFIKQVRFHSAHIFPYSRRSGTSAAKLRPLQPSIVTDRVKVLTAVQAQITSSILQTYVGKALRVLVENRKGDVHFATSAEYISVHIQTRKPLPLDWIDVSITGVEGNVLISTT